MADNLADFYTGAMAPPDRMPDGSLKPSIQTPQMSIAEMYRGIYGTPAPSPSRTAEGLDVRSVRTKDIVIGPNGFPVAQSEPEAAPPNGTGYQSGYVKTNNARLPAGDLPAVAAIEAAAPRRNLFGDSGYVAKPRFASSLGAMYDGADPGDTGMFGIPMSPDMAAIIASDPKYRAPPGSTPTKWKAAAPAPAAAPPPAGRGSLLGTLAALFSPPTAPSYTTTPFQESNFQTTSGAQMPSATNNSRWTTGY